MKKTAFLIAAFLFVLPAAAQEAPTVIEQEIEGIDFNLIGSRNNVSNHIWVESDPETAKKYMKKSLELATSPYNIKLLDNMLSSPSNNKDKDASLFEERLEQLTNIGVLDRVVELIGRVPDSLISERIARIKLNALFLQQDTAPICEQAQFFSSKFKTRYFEEVANFCWLLDDKLEQARIGLDIIKEQYKEESIYTKMADIFLNGGSENDLILEKDFDGFDMHAYFFLTGKLPPELGSRKELWATMMLAEENLSAAKKAVNLGLLHPDTLKKKLKGKDFSLEAYKSFFLESIQDGYLYLAPSMYLDDLKQVLLTEENMPYAALIIKSFLLTKQYSAAFEWYKKAEFLSGKDEYARDVSRFYGPLFKFLYDYGQSDNLVMDKYLNFKKQKAFSETEIFYEASIFKNLLNGRDMEDMSPRMKEIESAFKDVRNGEMIYMALQEIRDNPLKPDQIYHILYDAGFSSIAADLAIDSLIKTIKMDK